MDIHLQMELQLEVGMVVEVVMHLALLNQEMVEEELGKVIPLERAPVRLTVVHVGPERHSLVLNIHHIVTDGFSEALIEADLNRFYNALVAGESLPPVDEAKVRYVDYAYWQQELLADEAFMAPHLQYWRDTLGGDVPVLELQPDHPRPAVMTSAGSSLEFSVGREAGRKLGALCSQLGVSMMRGGLTAWAMLLCKHSGQPDVVVGMPYANRDKAGTSDVVGYFVNTLAVSVKYDTLVQDFRGAVTATSAVIGEAISHAYLPFVKVVEVVD